MGRSSRPGSVEKVNYEYEQNGAVNVLAMVEPKAGLYIYKVTETKTGDDFVELMANLGDYYQQAKKIIIVIDNYDTHSKQSLIHR